MPRTTPKRRAARGRPATPYVGKLRFASIGETRTGTNEEHVQPTLNELEPLRLAIALLNKNDVQLETVVRSADRDTLDGVMDLYECLKAIQERHQAIIDICRAAQARILIVGDRVVRGPQEAAHA
jgi:hypothetical protein